MGRDKYDEIDALQKEIRELKSLNRSLIKHLKKLSKGINKDEYERLMENLDMPTSQTKRSVIDRKKCQGCGKGNVIEEDVLGRIFTSCDICDYKSGKPVRRNGH